MAGPDPGGRPEGGARAEGADPRVGAELDRRRRAGRHPRGRRRARHRRAQAPDGRLPGAPGPLMYLLEHHAKLLAADHGIPSPAGALWAEGAALPPGPWVVKGQVAAGGRGKAGAIRKAEDRAAVDAAARAILGLSVRGQAVRAVRIEQNAGPAREAYVALLLDPAAGAVRVLMSADGGM